MQLPVVLKKILIGLFVVFLVISALSIGLIVWLVSGVGVYDRDAPRAQDDAGIVEPADPLYLLMVRDTRAGGNAAAMNSQSMQGDVGRTDSMTLIRLREDEGVDMVSLPRDLLIDIPECRRSDGEMTEARRDKLNSAYALAAVADSPESASTAGMDCAVSTVEKFVGARIEGSAVIDVVAVRDIVDSLGGVELCLTESDAARFSGLSAGCSTINGSQALDYARARHGVGDGSDLERIKRQQNLLGAVGKRIGQMSLPGDIPEMLRVANSLGDHLTADSSMVGPTMASRVVKATRNGPVSTRTMPVEMAPDGVNVVMSPAATTLWKNLRQGNEL